MPANFKTAVTYCKGRHAVGSNEFNTCYAKQTGPNANRSFINSASRKNRRNGVTRRNRKNRKSTRRNRRN